MDFDTSMKISASGLSASRVWVNVVSTNLANANTTRTEDGQPYQRRTVIYETAPVGAFGDELNSAMEDGLSKVKVADIVSDGRDFKEFYDPQHPDADSRGIVKMPNVNPVEEMANMVNASRSYEANLAALNTAKQLAVKAIELGR